MTDIVSAVDQTDISHFGTGCFEFRNFVFPRYLKPLRISLAFAETGNEKGPKKHSKKQNEKNFPLFKGIYALYIDHLNFVIVIK